MKLMDQQRLAKESFLTEDKQAKGADTPIVCIDNRYIVDRCLNRNDREPIFLVKDQLNNNLTVVLKCIDRALLPTERLTIFHKEFSVLERLKHPNIIKLLNFGCDFYNSHLSECYYFTMEYIKARSITKKPSEKNESRESRIISLAVQLCRALNLLHSRKIVHGNITVENILITQNNSVKLTDFDLGGYKNNVNNQDRILSFIAPEVFIGMSDKRSDIFSLGLVLYQLITGESFYQGCSREEIIALLKTKSLFFEHKQERIKTCLDTSLYTLINTMVTYDPDQRYQTGIEVITTINKSTSEQYPLETRETQNAYILGTSLIGRDFELQQLIDFVHREKEDKNILWVQGAAGIGKSRLLKEFKIFCQLNAICFFEGTCYDEINHQFDPFLQILKEMLLKAPESIIQKYGPELKKIIPDFERFSQIKLNPSSDPQTDRLILIRSISECILENTNLQSQKWVIHLSDIQWIDEASLDLIVTLQSLLNHQNEDQEQTQIPNLFLVLTSRLQDTQSISKTLSSIHIVKLILNPFSCEHIEEYCAAIFGQDSLWPQWKKSIPSLHEKTGGNPFILNEYIKSMIEAEAIIRQDWGWELVTPIARVNIPEKIENLITLNLDRLSITKEERYALQVLALLKRSASWEELHAITHVEQKFLNTMVHLEIINNLQSALGSYYQFSQGLIRDTISAQIPNPQSVHKHIAECLEQMVHDTIDLYAEDLAYHYYHAQVNDKALQYLEKASIKATKNWEIHKALNLYDKMLVLFHHEERERAIDVLFNKGMLLYNVGRIYDALTTHDQAIPLCAKIADRKRQALNNMQRGLCLVAIGYSFEDCLQCHLETLSLFESISDQEGISYTCHALGYLYFILKRNNEKALSYLQRGLRIAEQIGNSRCQARNLSEIAQVFHSKGDFDQAINCGEKTLKLFQEIDDKRDITINYGFIGFFYACKKDFTRALYYLNIQNDLAEELKNYNLQIGGLIKKAGVLLEMKNFLSARKHCDQALDLMQLYTPMIQYEYVQMANILSAKIDFALGWKEKGIKSLQDRLHLSKNNCERAKINFELWQMTLEPDYREIAMKFYQEIVKESSDYMFHARFQALNENCIIDKNIYAKQLPWHHETEETKNQEKKKRINNIIPESSQDNAFLYQILDIISNLNSDLQVSSVLIKILDSSIKLLQVDRGAILLLDDNQEIKIGATRNKYQQPIENFHLPKTIISKIITEKKLLFIIDLQDSIEIEISQSMAQMKLQSIMCVPLQRKHLNKQNDGLLAYESGLMGFIYLDSTAIDRSEKDDQERLKILQTLADQATVAIYNAMLSEKLEKSNTELEMRVKERTVELSASNMLLQKDEQKILELNRQLEEKLLDRTTKFKHVKNELENYEHKKELANLAISTLRNVRDLLNSISITAELAAKICHGTTLSGLNKANTLLRSKLSNLPDFIKNDSKGSKLFEYFFLLEEHFQKEIEESKKYFRRLKEKIKIVTDVITAQQRYGGHSRIEEISVKNILTDALIMLSEPLERRKIQVIKEFSWIPYVKTYKIQLMHVLINVIKNAAEAMKSIETKKRVLTLILNRTEKYVRIIIKDNGLGLSQENLTKMMQSDIAPNEETHGLSLFSCSRYLQDMNGSFVVHSDGIGQGTTATIELPINMNSSSSTNSL